MNDKQFYDIKDQLNRGASIFINLNSGKYCGSVCKALDTKTHTTYYDEFQEHKYEDHKIKVRINNRVIWLSARCLYICSQTHETIVTKSLVDQKKPAPKDFLDREFSVDDVVFLYSPTYGEILGVINKINEKGTLTIRVAKKTYESWSDRSKQGIFMVPYDRASRILIIDDPAVLLLRA